MVLKNLNEFCQERQIEKITLLMINFIELTKSFWASFDKQILSNFSVSINFENQLCQ